MGYFKTGILMVGLVLIFMFVGNAIGGAEGMKIAFFAACGMNFFSYFFSDSLVLKHYQAKEVNNNNAPELYQIVQRLANNAGLPMPKVYVVPEDVPNAFATGRNPDHAAVAVTQGLLKILSPQEIEGVLAHEMSHVRHHDILISSVAANQQPKFKRRWFGLTFKHGVNADCRQHCADVYFSHTRICRRRRSCPFDQTSGMADGRAFQIRRICQAISFAKSHLANRAYVYY